MTCQGLHHALGLGLGVPDLDGPVGCAGDDEELVEDPLSQDAPDLALVDVGQVRETPRLILLAFRESLHRPAGTLLLYFWFMNWMMEPSESPQVRISSAGENEAQIIFGLSTLVDFLSFMKDVFTSFAAGARNSLSFANYIIINFINLIE